MDAQTDKAARRRRKAPQRRIAPVIEHRERKPLFFGWGAELNRHERESVKERIALFAGIGIAAALAIILAVGWYQDNVAAPAAARAEANKPVAQVGNYIVRLGFFKSFEQFENTNFSNQLQQIQQQISQLTGQKNSQLQLAQLQAQQNQLQQELGSLPQNSLTTLLEDHTVLQRSYTLGYPVTAQVQNTAFNRVAQQAGGPKHLQQFISSSGLTLADIKTLVTADYLKSKISAKLAKGVSRNQLQVRASHILVPTTKKALAEKLYSEALHGANFAALAKKYSTDPGSGKKGGDLGYFSRGQMVSQFDKAAFSMKVGQIRLIQSQYGWHVIKLTGRKVARLSTSQYQQAQQSAYTQWIQQQQGILHVQRFVAPTDLPVVATPAANVGLPSNSGALPSGANPAVNQPVNPPSRSVNVAPRGVVRSTKGAPKLVPGKSGNTSNKP